MNCRLMGLDISTSSTGYSIFDNAEYVNGDIIDLSTEKNSDQRYKYMILNLLNTLNHYNPDIVCVERMHTIRQIEVFRKLCKLMGVVQSWCVTNGTRYVEVSPSEWRKNVKETQESLPRKRKELKEWSVQKVKTLFGVDVKDDVSDAILIGLSYINYINQIIDRERKIQE